MKSFEETEKYLGITPDNYEKKFVFSNQSSGDAFYVRPHTPSPTQLLGMSEDDQKRLRGLGCEMIVQAGQCLRLPITSVTAAQVMFHFFYQRHNFLVHDLRDVVMGVTYLACKSEDTLRRSAHIALVYDQIFKIQEKQRRPVRVPDVESPEFRAMQRKVIEMERVILIALGFETYRLCEAPHRYLNTILQLFSRHKQVDEIARKSWNFLNDSYRTKLCLHYPGNIIAAGCIQLALKVLGFGVPNAPWWCLLEASHSQLTHVQVELLSFYQSKKCSIFTAEIILNDLIRTNAATLGSEQTFFSLPYTKPPVLVASVSKPSGERKSLWGVLPKQLQSEQPFLQTSSSSAPTQQPSKTVQQSNQDQQKPKQVTQNATQNKVKEQVLIKTYTESKTDSTQPKPMEVETQSKAPLTSKEEMMLGIRKQIIARKLKKMEDATSAVTIASVPITRNGEPRKESDTINHQATQKDQKSPATMATEASNNHIQPKPAAAAVPGIPVSKDSDSSDDSDDDMLADLREKMAKKKLEDIAQNSKE